jgi:hypothetical protein
MTGPRKRFRMKRNSIGLALLTLLMGCGELTPPSILPLEVNVVSQDLQNRYIYCSAGIPPNPSTNVDGAWSFDFPTLNVGGHMNYIQTPFSATTSLHMMGVTLRTESNKPQYEVLDPGDILQATVHLFIEQKEYDLVNLNRRW